MRLLANARRLLAGCVDGITADRERMRALRRVVAEHRHPAEQVRRLRGGRQDRQAGARRRRDHPADGARPRVRRARRAHRGPARRGPRRGADDPPVTAREDLRDHRRQRRHRPRVRQPGRGRRRRAAGSCWSAAAPTGPPPRSGGSAPEQPSCRVDSLLCDFADQPAVRRLAEDLLTTCERIDVLVNNAGTVLLPADPDRRRHRVDVRGQPPRRVPAHRAAPRPARRERPGAGRLHLVGRPLLRHDGPRRPRLRARATRS